MKKFALVVWLLLNPFLCFAGHNQIHYVLNSADRKVMRNYGQVAHQRLIPYFKKAGLSYPPKKVAILAFKKERRMELWAKIKDVWHPVKNYPLTAISGNVGPKLKEYDRQIPEGIYKIQYLNPQSQLHLSMRLDYPNQFDRAHAKEDGRTRLGGDIFIHGKNISAGCLAIGDPAIEELYVLMHETGIKNAKVIIASNDIRSHRPQNLDVPHPNWVAELDRKLQHELSTFI